MQLIDIVADEDPIIEPTVYHIFKFFSLKKFFGRG